MSNDKLAMKIRDFYLCLVATGFQPDEALKLTERFVPECPEEPEIREIEVPHRGWAEAVERWVTNVEKSEAKRAPVTRPAQAESITELPRHTGMFGEIREDTVPRKTREKIEGALQTLCDAIGVYRDRIDCPVSLIFGNGLGLTESRKDGGHKDYTAGTNHVRDWIYENQRGK